MSEYIKREDAKIRIFVYGVRHIDNYDVVSACENLKRQMDAIPSVDMFERKTGKWIKKHDNICCWYECSECGNLPLNSIWTHEEVKSNFCPNCGAKMSGDSDV